MLQKDARIGELAFNKADRSLWGIRHLNGLCTIVRMETPYTEWTRVVTFPYGTVAYDLDVSPDGTKIVAAFGEIDGKMDVRVFPAEALLKGDTTAERRFDFGQSVPSSFVFSPDGRFVYGTSYLTGVSNVFRYEIATGETEAVSNTETGFFRPIPLGDDQLVVFRFTGQGLVPTRITGTPIKDAAPITFPGRAAGGGKAGGALLDCRRARGHPLGDAAEERWRVPLAGGLKSESFYPILQGYKDSAAVGMRWNLSDRLQLNRLSLSASYSPDTGLPTSERVHLRAHYQRYDWRAEALLNDADFYDLFGPTKTSRKGYGVERRAQVGAALRRPAAHGARRRRRLLG